MDKFCADIRKSIVHKVREDADRHVWVFRGATPHVPIEWSVILGEILYNLRSALDHLVWQLVVANGQTAGHHNAFPIVNSERAWQKATKRLEGVTSEVKEKIRCLQPYTGGLNLPFDVRNFWKLHSLCNIDKHRHLNIVIVGTSGIKPIVFGVNHPPLNKTSTSPPLRGLCPLGKIKKDKVLLCLNNAEVEFHPSFQIDLRFEDIGKPNVTADTVPSILHKCLETVRGAVGQLKSGKRIRQERIR